MAALFLVNAFHQPLQVSENLKGNFPLGFTCLLLYISTLPVTFSILNWFSLYHLKILICIRIMERSNYCNLQIGTEREQFGFQAVVRFRLTFLLVTAFLNYFC